jgi:hypothetical protein
VIVAKTTWKSFGPDDPIFSTLGPTTFTPVPRPVIPQSTERRDAAAAPAKRGIQRARRRT